MDSFPKHFLKNKSLSLSGYALVMVLTMITLFSIVILIYLNYQLFQTRQLLKMEHSVQRQLIYRSYCDSLESVNQLKFTDYYEEKYFTNPKGYSLKLTSSFFVWGFKGFLKIVIADPTGNDSFFVEIRRKTAIPEGTVLVYDNSNFGLALSDGSKVEGNILMLRPEIRDQKLNYNSKSKTVFAHHIYRMNDALLNYQIESGIYNNYIKSDFSDSVKIYKRRQFEISKPVTNFSQETEFHNCIFYVTKKTEFNSYPKGFDNQIILKANAVFRGKNIDPIDIVSLTDTLTILENTALSGNIFVLNYDHATKNKLILGHNSKLIGNLYADGTVVTDSNSIEGVMVANNIQVNLSPTTYAHYLINLELSPGENFSNSELLFPYFWQTGKLELK